VHQYAGQLHNSCALGVHMPMQFASFVQTFVMHALRNVKNTIWTIVKDVPPFVFHARKNVPSWLPHNIEFLFG
jgi:hypothetical protein